MHIYICTCVVCVYRCVCVSLLFVYTHTPAFSQRTTKQPQSQPPSTSASQLQIHFYRFWPIHCCCCCCCCIQQLACCCQMKSCGRQQHRPMTTSTAAAAAELEWRRGKGRGSSSAPAAQWGEGERWRGLLWIEVS